MGGFFQTVGKFYEQVRQEVDAISLLSDVRSLVSRAEYAPWQNYKGNLETAVRAYRGVHKEDIEALIGTYFPQAANRDEIVADVTNFVQKPINRASTLWTVPVVRTYYSNGNPININLASFRVNSNLA